MSVYSMKDMIPGSVSRVTEIPDGLPLKRRFYDLGLIDGTLIMCAFRSPLGGMSAYSIRGTLIAIRDMDCKKIMVEESV